MEVISMTINIQDGGSYFTPTSLPIRINLFNPLAVGTIVSLPEVAGNVYKILRFTTSPTVSDINVFVDGNPLIDNPTGGRSVSATSTLTNVGDFVICDTYSRDTNIHLYGRAIKQIFCKSFSVEKYVSDGAASGKLFYVTGYINKVK